MSEIEAKKLGGFVRVPNEMLWDIMGPFPPTPEQRAAYEQQKAERNAANAALMERLREVCCPAALVVVELHGPDENGDCGGCDVAGYEADQPSWPCRTVEAIAGHYGMAVEAP